MTGMFQEVRLWEASGFVRIPLKIWGLLGIPGPVFLISWEILVYSLTKRWTIDWKFQHRDASKIGSPLSQREFANADQ